MHAPNNNMKKTGGKKPVKQQPARKQVKIVRKNKPYRQGVTNIPVTSAYTIRNNQPTRIHVEKGKEYIGVLTIGPSTPSGTKHIIDINPIWLTGTRIENLCRSFGRYRFRSLRLNIASNFSTNVSGSLICGYMINADQKLANYPSIFNQVFTSANGVSKSLWTPITVDARLDDGHKWYYIDDDSEEIQNIQQGKFVIVVQSPVDVVKDVQIPLLLEYVIELRDPTNQSIREQSDTFDFPKASYVQRTTETKGEYHLTTGGAALDTGTMFLFDNPVLFPTANGNVDCRAMVYMADVGYSHSFYRTREDAVKHINLLISGIDHFDLPAIRGRTVDLN